MSAALLFICLGLLVVTGMCGLILYILLPLAQAYIAESKSKRVRGYFVSFMVFKNHDFRNQDVPAQEVLTHGVEFHLRSKCIILPSTHSNELVFSPSRIQAELWRMFQDDEITALEVLSVHPMTSEDVRSEMCFIEELQRK